MISILERINEMGLTVYQTVDRNSGRWHIVNCPFCSDTERKGAVHAESGAFRCFHENRCGVSYNWWDFQKALGYEPARKRTFDRAFYQAHKKKSYSIPKVKADKLSGKVLQYLKGRGFDEDTLEAFNIKQKDGAVAIPFYKNGKCVGVKYRAITDKKMWSEKGSEPVLFNRDNAVGDELTIVEGEFDAIAGAMLGINAVSVPNGTGDSRWIEQEWEWLEQFRKIYLILDNDTAGQDAVQDIVNRLGKWRCFNVLLPAKDLNDCLLKKIPAEQIIQCIENAQEFRFEMLRSAEELIDETIDMTNNPEGLYGVHTAFEKLDYILKGWRKAEVTVIQGNTGHGKSTLMTQMCADLVRKGQKVCVANLETGAKKYLLKTVKQSNIYGNIDEGTIRSCLDQIGQDVYLVDYSEHVELDLLMDIFEYAHRRYGVQFFLVDNLMMIKMHLKDEYSEQKRLMNRFLEFAKKFQVHIFLVVHPRKQLADDHIPNIFDISGTAHIGNLASNILTHFRIPQKWKEKAEKNGEDIADAFVVVQKNREFGYCGKVNLTFNATNDTFMEVS